MFCRYCGANIAEDSLFCAKCGKRLGKRENPRLAKIVQTLRLKTPYPYFALLLALFVTWTVATRRGHADYSNLKWSFELDRTADLQEENLYRQALSIVVENVGSIAIEEVPVDLSAKIEPAKKADVEADFQGRRLLILQEGRTLPVTPILGDGLAAGAKKRYPLNVSIQAEPPFKVTYELREEDGGPLLANYVVEK